jgi:hypothetical protein
VECNFVGCAVGFGVADDGVACGGACTAVTVAGAAAVADDSSFFSAAVVVVLVTVEGSAALLSGRDNVSERAVAADSFSVSVGGTTSIDDGGGSSGEAADTSTEVCGIRLKGVFKRGRLSFADSLAAFGREDGGGGGGFFVPSEALPSTLSSLSSNASWRNEELGFFVRGVVVAAATDVAAAAAGAAVAEVGGFAAVLAGAAFMLSFRDVGPPRAVSCVARAGFARRGGVEVESLLSSSSLDQSSLLLSKRFPNALPAPAAVAGTWMLSSSSEESDKAKRLMATVAASGSIENNAVVEPPAFMYPGRVSF